MSSASHRLPANEAATWGHVHVRVDPLWSTRGATTLRLTITAVPTTSIATIQNAHDRSRPSTDDSPQRNLGS